MEAVVFLRGNRRRVNMWWRNSTTEPSRNSLWDQEIFSPLAGWWDCSRWWKADCGNLWCDVQFGPGAPCAGIWHCSEISQTHKVREEWEPVGTHADWIPFTRTWWPSGDFPEYNRVASVRRTEAWGEIDNYEPSYLQSLAKQSFCTAAKGHWRLYHNRPSHPKPSYFVPLKIILRHSVKLKRGGNKVPARTWTSDRLCCSLPSC